MKTIVITGSTSGIGEAILKSYAKDNIIFAGYRNEKYADELKSLSENVIPFYIDMSDKNSISASTAYIKSKTDNIDTLINVAGCVVAGAMENIEIDRIREQFEVNTFSHLDFSQRLLNLLDGGKIINISSMSSFGIFPFIAPYGASKRALDILFNCMQLEMKRDIKIVSVKPGVIATPLWEKSLEQNKELTDNNGDYEKEMKYMVSNARKNGTKGLDVRKVVELIEKIDNQKNPKSSYTIGYDAKFAEILSKLPQDWINGIVKLGLKSKLNRFTLLSHPLH